MALEKIRENITWRELFGYASDLPADQVDKNELKKKYYKMSLNNHPDKYSPEKDYEGKAPGDHETAVENFKIIANLYYIALDEIDEANRFKNTNNNNDFENNVEANEPSMRQSSSSNQAKIVNFSLEAYDRATQVFLLEELQTDSNLENILDTLLYVMSYYLWRARDVEPICEVRKYLASSELRAQLIQHYKMLAANPILHEGKAWYMGTHEELLSEFSSYQPGEKDLVVDGDKIVFLPFKRVMIVLILDNLSKRFDLKNGRDEPMDYHALHMSFSTNWRMGNLPSPLAKNNEISPEMQVKVNKITNMGGFRTRYAGIWEVIPAQLDKLMPERDRKQRENVPSLNNSTRGVVPNITMHARPALPSAASGSSLNIAAAFTSISNISNLFTNNTPVNFQIQERTKIESNLKAIIGGEPFTLVGTKEAGNKLKVKVRFNQLLGDPGKNFYDKVCGSALLKKKFNEQYNIKFATATTPQHFYLVFEKTPDLSLQVRSNNNNNIGN